MVRADIARLREEAEARIRALLARDSYWKKCYPCRNNGRCCRDDDPPALPGELEEIEGLLERDAAARQGMLVNLRRQGRCIFYRPDASSCLVHEARPLICRLTPFKGHVAEYGVTVFDGTGNDGCGAFLRRCPDIEETEGAFVRTAANVYIRVDDLFETPPRTHLSRHFYGWALEKGLL